MHYNYVKKLSSAHQIRWKTIKVSLYFFGITCILFPKRYIQPCKAVTTIIPVTWYNYFYNSDENLRNVPVRLLFGTTLKNQLLKIFK